MTIPAMVRKILPRGYPWLYQLWCGRSCRAATLGYTGYGGKITSSGQVFVNSGILVIDAADWGPNASKGSIFRSGYDVPINNNCKIDVAALPINI